MTTQLQEFFWDRYSAAPLMLGSKNAVPGMLLEVEWHGQLPNPWLRNIPRILREDGFVWDLLSLKKGDYNSDRTGGNIIQESINDRRSLSGKATLPEYGISFGGKFLSKFSVDLKVTGVEPRVFDNTARPYQLMEKLLSLKKTDPSLWRWVNDDLLITECFYVTSFQMEFGNDRGLSAQVEADKDKTGITIDASMEHEWVNDCVLKLEGTPAVPLAVRGLRV